MSIYEFVVWGGVLFTSTTAATLITQWALFRSDAGKFHGGRRVEHIRRPPAPPIETRPEPPIETRPEPPIETRRREDGRGRELQNRLDGIAAAMNCPRGEELHTATVLMRECAELRRRPAAAAHKALKREITKHKHAEEARHAATTSY